MGNSSGLKPNQKKMTFSYFTGLLTGLVIIFLVLLFIVYKVGFAKVSNFLEKQLIPSDHYSRVLNLPESILEELKKVEAPIDNAHNPTQIPEHDSFFIRHDEELEYVLKPDVKIGAYMMKSTKAFNMDPPVIHFQHGDIHKLSSQLKAYINEQSRMYFEYSTDGKGFRKTIPNVTSDRKILIIGDSVPFGVGVDDENTAASHLQKLVGEQFKVLNAAVGGYNGTQAYLVAKKLSNQNNFDGLIYVACQNDFMIVKDWVGEAKKVLSKIQSLSNKFNNNVMVILITYMEYNLRDIFLIKGWKEEKIHQTHLLRNSMHQITEKLNFEYRDWTDNVHNFMEQEKSIFSRFALYSDHTHLSPLGNRLLANTMYSIIQSSWSLNTEKSARKIPGEGKSHAAV